MPRTVESIVENHRAARALRNQGKPIWTYHLNIKSILGRDPENTDPLYLKVVAHEVARQLRAKLPAPFFDITNDKYEPSLTEVTENLEDATDQTFAPSPEDPNPIEMLNGWIDELFDWADANRAWLGR